MLDNANFQLNKYLKIQRKGALLFLSSFVWSKSFSYLVCTMKNVWLGMSNHIMAISLPPIWLVWIVCVCLCLFTNWAQTEILGKLSCVEIIWVIFQSITLKFDASSQNKVPILLLGLKRSLISLSIIHQIVS